MDEGFGFLDEFLADLVGAPALPAFEFACFGQGCVGLGFDGGIKKTGVCFHGVAQRVGCGHAGFAVAVGQFLLECLNDGSDGLLGLEFAGGLCSGFFGLFVACLCGVLAAGRCSAGG